MLAYFGVFSAPRLSALVRFHICPMDKIKMDKIEAQKNMLVLNLSNTNAVAELLLVATRSSILLLCFAKLVAWKISAFSPQ
jgi:hypothetical protein